VDRIRKPKNIKENNRKVILSYLQVNGPKSIAQLSKKSRLSVPTITKIIDHYVNTGLVMPNGKGTSTEEGGKKPVLFDFNPKAKYALGVQLWYNKIFAILTDLNGSIVDETEEPLDIGMSIEAVLDILARIYRELTASHGIGNDRMIGIAIGIHGVTNYVDGVLITTPHHRLWPDNIRIRDMMEQRLSGLVPVYVDNWMRFITLAEQRFGNWQSKHNIIVLQNDIGTIAGVMIDDTIRRGSHFLAGSIGHMIIDADSDEICDCGGRGCFGSLVSSERVLSRVLSRREQEADSMIFRGRENEEIEMQDIFDACNAGDTFAREIMDEVIKWFSIGMHNILLTYDPDIVVIQGYYATAGDYFLSRLKEQINEVSLLKVTNNVEIEYSRLGKKAAVLGAAAYLCTEYMRI
jgi:predicted NBD/HSP70 family sugar kinase